MFRNTSYEEGALQIESTPMTVYQSSMQWRHAPRLGAQLRGSRQALFTWLQIFIVSVDKRPDNQPLEPAVRELQVLIETNADLRMLASAMFSEIPNTPPYVEDPTKHWQVRDYSHMLRLLSIIMTEITPMWSMADYEIGLLGLPFTAVLAWPMATASGRAFFLRKEVNEKLKAILDTWRNDTLMTAKSLHAITADEGGWLCAASLAALERDGNREGSPWCSFRDLFQCDPLGDPVHWGFRSWDDFFTRQFRDIDALRPVGQPNKPEWIVSACESRPYALQGNIQAYDNFWLKGNHYSVKEMLGHHDLATEFVGGTVFQAFLSLTSYHRWCSPVSGEVIDTKIINGTYFSEPPFAGFAGSNGPDPSGPDRSQVYITQVATRALVFIRAPEPIGIMCAIFVGMSDVSTCEIAQHLATDLPKTVSKGEEIGTFRHGGSSYCLLFRRGLKLTWVPGAMPRENGPNLPVRSELAQAYLD